MKTAYNLTLLGASSVNGLRNSSAIIGDQYRQKMGLVGKKIVGNNGGVFDGYDSSCDRHLSGLMYRIVSISENKAPIFRLMEVKDGTLGTDFPINFIRFNDGSLWDYDLLRNDIDRRRDAIITRCYSNFSNNNSRFGIVNGLVDLWEKNAVEEKQREEFFYEEFSKLLIGGASISRLTAARLRCKNLLFDLKYRRSRTDV